MTTPPEFAIGRILPSTFLHNSVLLKTLLYHHFGSQRKPHTLKLFIFLCKPKSKASFRTHFKRTAKKGENDSFFLRSSAPSFHPEVRPLWGCTHHGTEIIPVDRNKGRTIHTFCSKRSPFNLFRHPLSRIQTIRIQFG